MNDEFTEAEKSLTEQSRYACWELAKYLFAANSGAAAGLLLLLRTAQEHCTLIVSYSFFCLGAFSVLVSCFFGASHAVEVARGFQNDLLCGTEKTALIQRHNKRLNGWKTWWIAIAAILSFIFLILGGIFAALPFFHGKIS